MITIQYEGKPLIQMNTAEKLDLYCKLLVMDGLSKQTHTHTHTHILCIRFFLYMYVCVCVCVYTHINLSLSLSLSCVCIYIYIYIYIYTHTPYSRIHFFIWNTHMFIDLYISLTTPYIFLCFLPFFSLSLSPPPPSLFYLAFKGWSDS